MVALAEMLHEGGQTDKQHSEAIVPLLSTQHSGTLTNQTSPLRRPLAGGGWCNGVECVNLLLHMFFPRALPVFLQ